MQAPVRAVTAHSEQAVETGAAPPDPAAPPVAPPEAVRAAGSWSAHEKVHVAARARKGQAAVGILARVTRGVYRAAWRSTSVGVRRTVS